MGEGRTGEPLANQRLTVAQAAVTLGITEGAVRSRIKRGTLPTVKEGGTVYVVFSGTSKANHAPHADVPAGQSELVASLQDQVSYLREQLAAERETNRENRRLLAAALERIPAIEAPESPESTSEPSDTPEPRSTTEGQQEQTSQPQEGRSWWRRMFGA